MLCKFENWVTYILCSTVRRKPNGARKKTRDRKGRLKRWKIQPSERQSEWFQAPLPTCKVNFCKPGGNGAMGNLFSFERNECPLSQIPSRFMGDELCHGVSNLASRVSFLIRHLCANGGSFWKVGITADLFARVAMPIFHGLWTFHIWTYEHFDGFGL